LDFSALTGYFFSMKNLFFKTIFIFSFLIILNGCAGRPQPSSIPTDGTSATEIAIAIAGGAIQAASPVGTQASFKMRREPSKLKLFAQYLTTFSFMSEAQAWINSPNACPNIQNSVPVMAPTSCLSGAGGKTITYGLANCHYVGALGAWGGQQFITLTSNSATTLACSSGYPFVANDTFTRSWGLGSSRAAVSGVVVLVDTSGGTSGVINPILTTGETVTVGATNSIVVNGVHLAASLGNYIVWDFTVQTASGSPIVVNSTTGAVTSGIISTENNKAGYTAKTDISNLTFAPGCCYPLNAEVTTTFSVSAGSTVAAPAPEVMDFGSKCGVAKFNNQLITLQECF
jgi:hypothetical protein